jgi:diguanylate cyclase (GGDEF)-like protein/PAS domain S-box-containing protein
MKTVDEADFKFLAENSADIICRVAPGQNMTYVSPASIHVLGWTPEEMMAMPPFALVFPEDIPDIQAAMERGLNEGVPFPAVGRTRKKDGTFLWMEVTGRLGRDPVTGEFLETVLVMRDIHQRKLQEEQLSILAQTDGLTGLANRRAFDEALEREWKRTLREGSQMSLLLLDIDHFKQFNDEYGHQIGDDCLRTVAGAIRESVRRSTDVVARYGGEEIAVILPSTDSSIALAIAETVRHSVEALEHITHGYTA